MARSEKNKVGNTVYTDLNMTAYPKEKDALTTNATTKDKRNPNMLGWVNIGEGDVPDYVWAEHVNALVDAVRALQRAVGTEPMLPADVSGLTESDINTILQTKSVKTRIDDMENRNFDERYGGPGWTPTADRTLANHTHNGEAGRPEKILLTGSAEVRGLLAKSNLDLSLGTGLTGADINISSVDSTKIKDAITEKLSTRDGGVVQGNVEVRRKFNSRTGKEYGIEDFNGTEVSDAQTLSGTRKESGSTASIEFLRRSLQNLQFGKYVLGVRVKLVEGSLSSTNVLRLRCSAQTNDAQEEALIMASEFEQVGKWKMFYLVFDHEPANTAKAGEIIIEKLSTASNAKIAIDHAYITVAHPAVFDR